MKEFTWVAAFWVILQMKWSIYTIFIHMKNSTATIEKYEGSITVSKEWNNLASDTEDHQTVN